MKIKILLILVFVGLSNHVFYQIQVKGNVCNDKGENLLGVTKVRYYKFRKARLGAHFC